jgi:hypothetical protein
MSINYLFEPLAAGGSAAMLPVSAIGIGCEAVANHPIGRGRNTSLLPGRSRLGSRA